MARAKHSETYEASGSVIRPTLVINPQSVQHKANLLPVWNSSTHRIPPFRCVCKWMNQTSPTGKNTTEEGQQEITVRRGEWKRSDV